MSNLHLPMVRYPSRCKSSPHGLWGFHRQVRRQARPVAEVRFQVSAGVQAHLAKGARVYWKAGKSSKITIFKKSIHCDPFDR